MTGKKSERDRERMCIADIKITRAYNKWEHEIKGEREIKNEELSDFKRQQNQRKSLFKLNW